MLWRPTSSPATQWSPGELWHAVIYAAATAAATTTLVPPRLARHGASKQRSLDVQKTFRRNQEGDLTTPYFHWFGFNGGPRGAFLCYQQPLWMRSFGIKCCHWLGESMAAFEFRICCLRLLWCPDCFNWQEESVSPEREGKNSGDIERFNSVSCFRSAGLWALHFSFSPYLVRFIKESWESFQSCHTFGSPS